MAATTERPPTPEQHAAIEAEGLVFVSAGAGTGKTSVLVERFARAIDSGIDVASILVITYTERAAAELRSRIRERLVKLGRPELTRELDGAWISTIHGFCLRLLKQHPFAAGLDPRFRVLDESQGAVLRAEAFEEALTEFCGGEQPDRLALLATYGSAALRRMLTGVYETLRAAGRPLALPLGEAPSLDDAIARVRAAAGDANEAVRLVELLDRRPATESLLDLSGYAVKGDDDYEQARAALEQAALNVVAARDRALLEELLVEFERSYTAAKDRESALDFEDLQIRARDLLRDDASIREREQLRFRQVCVDEFQDTNRLQCEVIDLIAREDLFFVGDEFQSIYRFRHADVEVFKERRDQVGDVLPLTQNWRSRPEVLAVVNELFGATFGDEFQRLVAAGRFPDPGSGPAVELLVTDKSSYKDAGVPWRQGEARALARRVHELVESGEAEPGEIVLLFAAGTDAEQYEQALRELGLPTYRATGRGYFGQQQVVDLLGYLRLIHNRYDDEGLVSVLASPFVGVSNDGLLTLRRAATRRPLFTALEKGLPEGLSERDARLLQAFRQRYDRLTALAGTVGLERLCEQIVVEHDYDLAVLVQWDGRRRYANLRKLARLARSYEELRGPDIEGFVRFVSEQDAAGVKELEAVAEEEGAGAVRLLTIHAAKGLEFKVVVVADAGRERPPTSGEEIICLPDGRFGFKVVDPLTGKRVGALGYEQVRDAEEAAEEAERLRLYYVAMTRAIDKLIVAGSIDPARRDPKTPIGWVLDRLELGELDDGEVVQGEARLLLRVDRFTPDVEQADESVVQAADPQLSLFDAEGSAAVLTVPPLPPLRDVHRARDPACPAALVFGARAVRALSLPVLRRAPRRPAPGGRRHPGCRHRHCRRDGGQRDRRLRAPAARADRPVGPRAALTRPRARLVPDCVDIRARTDRESRRGVLLLAARCSPRRPRERVLGAAVRLRARRRALPRRPRRPPSRRCACSRRRLQVEPARRARNGRRGRGRVPAPAPRLRHRVLPGRRRRGRGRLPVPRAARRARGGDLPPRRAARARGGALRGHRPDPGGAVPASPERVRVCGVSGAGRRLRRTGAHGVSRR